MCPGRRFARRHRLTVNTLVQGAWALLLSRYGGAEDVVFGVTVAGRPAELPGKPQKDAQPASSFATCRTAENDSLKESSQGIRGVTKSASGSVMAGEPRCGKGRGDKP